MLKVFEAFAGIGSQRKALENLGIEHEVVAISEIDKYAIKSYEAIYGEVNNLGDITKINLDDIPGHDLFTYSFPCQDISLAGKQKGLDKNSETKSSLLWECERVIEHCRPKYLLLENVRNLVGKKHKANFDEWLKILDDLGYANYWKILNAKDYGVAQNRERVFVVSIRKDLHQEFNFPQKQELTKCLKNYLEDDVDEKFYLKDEIVKTLELKDNIRNNVCKQIGNIMHKSYSSNQSKRVYSIEKSSPCLTAHASDVTPKIIVENTSYKIRKLTPLECWRLMGFDDDDFYKAQVVNSNTQLYKQAGNSIVVDVLMAIFSELFKEELDHVNK